MQGYPRRRLQTRPRPATGLSEGHKARMVEKPGDRTLGAGRGQSTRACWPCRSCAGFGTGTTSDRSPNTPVSFAGVNRRTPTTCDLPKAAPSDARSVTSSPSRCVGGHHREVHRYGDEANWWRKAGIDPMAAARALWLETYPEAHLERLIEKAYG